MGFRQTFKGIFQFKDQSALERAMAENQAEAMGADAMGIQDSYHSNAVMLLDIDTEAEIQDWEEMSVAVATLAMHASNGFLYAVAHDGGATGPRTEYFEAEDEGFMALEEGAAPAEKDDYFVLREGAKYTYKAALASGEEKISWQVRKISVKGEDFYYFEDSAKHNIHYNDYWDGTYYRKHGSLVDAVMADTIEELKSLDFRDGHTHQPAYNNNGKPGDSLYVIWKEDDHFLEFKLEDFVTLSLPYGRIEDCMKVRMDLYHVMGSEMYRESQYQYFAKGIGLVRWERGDSLLELSEYKPS